MSKDSWIPIIIVLGGALILLGVPFAPFAITGSYTPSTTGGGISCTPATGQCEAVFNVNWVCEDFTQNIVKLRFNTDNPFPYAPLKMTTITPVPGVIAVSSIEANCFNSLTYSCMVFTLSGSPSTCPLDAKDAYGQQMGTYRIANFEPIVEPLIETVEPELVVEPES